MAKVIVNKTDIDRITSKLNAFEKELKSNSGPLFTYRLLLLNEYRTVVAGAMGSVSAYKGGRVDIKFLSPRSTYWSPLSPATQILKAYKQSTVTRNLTIWKNTGKTQQAVFNSSKYEDFAGIDSTDSPDEYAKALATEFGASGGGWEMKSLTAYTNWPSRALFTIANQAFLDNKELILEKMMEAIRATKDKVGWGM